MNHRRASNGRLEGKPTTSGRREVMVHGEGACGDESCRLEIHLSITVPDVVLVSGFGPFSGVPVNPSWLAVEPLKDTTIAGYDVRVIQVPVIWEEALPMYLDAYDRLRPSIALTSGVAAGESGIRLETTARNYARGVDVAEQVWHEGKIDAFGPDAYETALPVDLLVQTLGEADYPNLVSDNAGDYLCNFLFYGLMKHLASEPSDGHVVAGFVHVPSADVVDPRDMTDAWKLMIARLVEYRAEIGVNPRVRRGADLAPVCCTQSSTSRRGID